MSQNEKDEMSDFSHPSVEQIIKKIEDDAEVFRSTAGEAFIKTKNNNKISPIDSADFECWLRRFCHRQFGALGLSPGVVSSVAGHLKMLAFDSKTRKIHRRFCDKENAIYYDLGLDEARYLKITNDEIKHIKNSKLLMMRNHIFCPQVEPDLEGSPDEILGFVEKHFNFSSESEKLLFSVFLVASFFTESMPMPIIQLYGEKASGKTLCEKRILDLLNPVSTGVLALPKKLDDIAMCLSSDCIVAFDNVGWINEEVSNLFCLVSTGAMLAKRKLYTDNTQMFRDLKTIVIFNSVNQCVTKSDLADRILTFHLERFSQRNRKGELELKKEWEQDKPRFFGAICRAVQGVLGDKKKPKKSSPFRLVDFYELSVKAGRQLGFTEKDVYNAFKENHNTINDAIVSGDIVLTTIEQYMAQQEEDEILTFTPTNFYTTLKDFAHDELGIGRGFPGAAGALTRRLGENKSNLEDIGIFFEKRRSSDRIIEIWRSKK